MRVIIQSDYQKMSQWAANHVIERINEFKPTPDHKFVLGLPTGSSPVGMYNALVEANRAGKVSFKNVITFISLFFYYIDIHCFKDILYYWHLFSKFIWHSMSICFVSFI